ncbi:MAG: nitroreductase/quinone reductase family protein [Nocardioides sp.]
MAPSCPSRLMLRRCSCRGGPAARPHGLATRALHLVGRFAGAVVRHPRGGPRRRRAAAAHGGRVLGLVGPLPTATLATTGARSGLRRRETPVVYFHDGDDVILVASSFGRDRHPGWYHNALHPDVQLNGLPFRAAEVTDESEYERLYGLATRVYGGYADYRVRTATAGRRIPVLRLTPTG